MFLLNRHCLFSNIDILSRSPPARVKIVVAVRGLYRAQVCPRLHLPLLFPVPPFRSMPALQSVEPIAGLVAGGAERVTSVHELTELLLSDPDGPSRTVAAAPMTIATRV